MIVTKGYGTGRLVVTRGYGGRETAAILSSLCRMLIIPAEDRELVIR